MRWGPSLISTHQCIPSVISLCAIFYSEGHILFLNACMRFSWCFMVQRCVFWQLQPRTPSMGQTGIVLHDTATTRSMRKAMCFSVHSLVSKPGTVVLSSSLRCQRCAGCWLRWPRWTGLPRLAIGRKAALSLSSSTAFHAYAVGRATPIICVTCAKSFPASRRYPARTRQRVTSPLFFDRLNSLYKNDIGIRHEMTNHCRGLHHQA